ncbi:MAG: 16S rRNA (guanine(527)-N(7))-methyltransferase RsmG [Thermodesulfovibrionia bacterium]|nr:16S rRNA (guanine(527)-N(7))-methyltransferase RsmG [Thermodesulfovibrionia bacterium]
MSPEELLKKGLNELGFLYSEDQIDTFMTFLHELKKWNRVYSLTALKTDEDIIIKHFLDSILYLKALEEIASPRHTGARNDRREGLKIADAGTGAGFPGIPIKIIKPELDMTLIESSRKKSVFLRHIIRILKLNGISVLNDRIESLGKRYEKTYDVIVSRATFKIRDFLKKACPYIKEDGWLVLSKGPKVSEETNFLDEVHRQSVMKEVITLPFIKAKRTLLMFQCQK